MFRSAFSFAASVSSINCSVPKAPHDNPFLPETRQETMASEFHQESSLETIDTLSCSTQELYIFCIDLFSKINIFVLQLFPEIFEFISYG